MHTDTIPVRLVEQARKRPTEPAYYVKNAARWQPVEWRTYRDQVRRAGQAMIALGLEPGDKVTMLGFNRPEWVIFNLAAMSIGAVGVGVYATSSAAEVQYIVDHSEARLLLVEDESQWHKVASRRGKMPRLERVIMMRGAPAVDDSLVLSWEEFESRGAGVSELQFDSRLGRVDPDALGALIYTSGTTGPPKGVMLTHYNLAWTASALVELAAIDSNDWSLSYLPLSHIAEQMLTIHGAITAGAVVYYAESLDRVADNVREVEPSVFFGVPRIWEKYHAAVSSRLDAAGGARRSLVEWARRVGSRVNRHRDTGRRPGVLLSAQYRIADYLIFARLKKALGLANARLCLSGAAPIAREILDFFASLDIPIKEVYGQSEDSGPTSINLPGKTRPGSVGAPIAGLEVEIAGDGEILVRGPSVFAGYYKDESATRETLDNGWLHTGDLGRFDEDHFLHITGRKKEIIITAGGKNIAPGLIESALKSNQLIDEAVVIGDRRKFLSALITLNGDVIGELAAGGRAGGESIADNPALRAAVQEIVDGVNSELARVETIKKFTILPREFSVEGGELTPTLKIRRAVIGEKYAREIARMYGDS